MPAPAGSITELSAALRCVPGIGNVLADRIAAAVGMAGAATDVFEDPVEALSCLRVPGFGSARLAGAAQAVEDWVRSAAFRELRTLLPPSGFGPLEVSRIVAGLRDLGVADPAATILANPYELLLLDWLTWEQVDEFARGRMAPGDDQRVLGALCSATYLEVRRGHTCALRRRVVAVASRLLDAPPDYHRLARMLREASAKDGRLRQERFKEGIAVYPRALYFAERRLAEDVARRRAGAVRIALPQAPGTAGRVLGALGRSGFCAVTGAAGTGKTSLVREVLGALDAGIPVALLAPTGKAARVLSERCRRPADTVHHWLGLAPNATHPIVPVSWPVDSGPPDPALVVVDEASVLDLPLAAHLFRRAARSAVLLVGDTNQISPVGPGRPLSDILQAGMPEVGLTAIHRQRVGSLILENAHRVLAAAAAGGPVELSTGEGFEVRAASSAEAIQEAAVERALAFGPSVQVLTAQKVGAGGLHSLNAALRKHRNPRAGSATFHQGDRVICTRNSRIHGTDGDGQVVGLFNGMEGEVTDVRESEVHVEFDGTVPVGADFDPSEAEGMLDLAWSLTVHRAQGSEWPAVVIVVPSEHRAMWTWQLLYTAITRATESVCIVGDPETLRTAGQRSAPDRRGHLVDRIREAGRRMRASAPLRSDF